VVAEVAITVTSNIVQHSNGGLYLLGCTLQTLDTIQTRLGFTLADTYMNTMAMEYSCRNVKSFLDISVGLSASKASYQIQ